MWFLADNNGDKSNTHELKLIARKSRLLYMLINLYSSVCTAHPGISSPSGVSEACTAGKSPVWNYQLSLMLHLTAVSHSWLESLLSSLQVGKVTLEPLLHSWLVIRKFQHVLPESCRRVPLSTLAQSARQTTNFGSNTKCVLILFKTETNKKLTIFNSFFTFVTVMSVKHHQYDKYCIYMTIVSNKWLLIILSDSL